MKLQRNPAVPSTELNGEQVFMDLETGKYYSLKDTGLAIWQLLETPQKEDSLYGQLAAEYGIAESQCRQDSAPFIERLLAVGLLIRQAD